MVGQKMPFLFFLRRWRVGGTAGKVCAGSGAHARLMEKCRPLTVPRSLPPTMSYVSALGLYQAEDNPPETSTYYAHLRASNG